MNVLVADDDETIRLLVTQLFRRRGDRVVTAADGAEAIERLMEGPFDLLVLDLMMPRTDGLGVLAYLRGRSARSPQVIVITAGVPALIDAVPRSEVRAVIRKPFDLESLLNAADATQVGP